MRLLLGFETPQKGAIYYDGRDMNRIDMRSLRRQARFGGHTLTIPIDYLAGGGDDECQVGVYEQDSTKGDASLKDVGVNVYIEDGDVDTLYGGSRVTPASTLALFDQKALNIYTPVTVNISGGHVGSVYGMNDFTAFTNSSPELADYVRRSYIHADSTINISEADSADYVVGDLYRNLPVSALNQRHVLGTTRANITASNSFERLNLQGV